MNDQQLPELLDKLLSSGSSKEEIYSRLISEGWSVDQIQTRLEARQKTQPRPQDKTGTEQYTIGVILSAAAVVTSIGVLSLLFTYWQEIPRFIRMVLILLPMSLSYFAGWHFRFRAGMTKTGNALIFLGIVFYGIGIFLADRMFEAHLLGGDKVIIWMLGVLLLAYFSEIKAIFNIGIILGLVVVAMNSDQTLFAQSSQLLISGLFMVVSGVASLALALFFKKQDSNYSSPDFTKRHDHSQENNL